MSSVLHCANIPGRTFLQLAVSLECTYGTRKGALQAWGCGNISKGNEVRKRMSGRGCCRVPHYNEKYYPEGPIKRAFFLSSLSVQSSVFGFVWSLFGMYFSWLPGNACLSALQEKS